MKNSILPILLFLSLTSCYYSRIGYENPIGSPIPGNNVNTKPPGIVSTKNNLIGLAVSGGGSRAAYLTAAILREIHNSQIRVDLSGEEKSADPDLLNQIDFISAVSGGSLSSAYFVLNKDELIKSDVDARPWRTYLKKMSANIRWYQWYAYGLCPINWLLFATTNFNRGNIAREYYNSFLFKGKTIGDLHGPPALYLNATDISNSRKFVFSNYPILNRRKNGQDQDLDLLYPEDLWSFNIDSRTIRIADAAYASSAFPFIYPNLAIYDWRTKLQHPLPSNDKYKIAFLADGGLFDNWGLGTLFTQMEENFHLDRVSSVIIIYIVASINKYDGPDMTPQIDRDTEYAWHHTHLGHGLRTMDTVVDHEIYPMIDFIIKQSSPPNSFQLPVNDSYLRLEQPYDRDGNTFWDKDKSTNNVLCRPFLIPLALGEIAQSSTAVVNAFRRADSKINHRLDQLLKLNNLPHDNFALALSTALPEIKTDFVLRKKHKNLLDLAAFVLVHGVLEPNLVNWTKRVKPLLIKNK